jgi:hypothetical protein
LPAVSYECGSSFLTSREHRLRVFGNRVFEEDIWAQKRENDRKLKRMPIEELQDVCSSPSMFSVTYQRGRTGGDVAGMGRREMTVGFLAGKPDGKKPCGRHGCRWEGMLKCFKEVDCNVDCIHLAMDRSKRRIVVNTVVNLLVL